VLSLLFLLLLLLLLFLPFTPPVFGLYLLRKFWSYDVKNFRVDRQLANDATALFWSSYHFGKLPKLAKCRQKNFVFLCAL